GAIVKVRRRHESLGRKKKGRRRMLLLCTSTPIRIINGLIAAFAFTFLFFLALVHSSSAAEVNMSSISDSHQFVDTVIHRQTICSRTCVVENCDSFGIRYGKYCGLGWTGCPGEKPCDDLDACCKIHDNCVGKKGLTNIKCHQKFKACAKRVQKSGKLGFSNQCTYERAIPTMLNGIDMGILLSQFGEANLEL
ncbi:Probable phospholipase A2 homolog 1, partial [Linum perenne]